MTDQPDDDRLDRLLEELGPAEPPPGLVQTVMARVRAFEHGTARRRVIAQRTGGPTMTRKAMWGLAAAAAVALGVFIVKGFPAVDRGTEGTVGAAKRYQAQQLSDKDVVVGDAQIQEFLQSDTFDRLMKDDAARNLLTNRAVRNTFSDANFVHQLSDRSVRSALTNRDVIAAFSDSSLKAELAASLAAGVQANLGNKAIENASLKNAIKSDIVGRVMADSALVHSLSNQAVFNALNNADLRNALSADYAAAALNSNAFINAINNAAFSNAMRSNLIDAQLASGLHEKK